MVQIVHFFFGAMPRSHRSLKGQLLVDGGSLHGSFFHRSVVLVCDHDREGALGLVLNKTSEKTVAELILEPLPSPIQSAEVFLGGPVQPSALSYLHCDSSVLRKAIFGELRLGHSLEELVEIGQRGHGKHPMRIFAGYSGWSALQLDEEMKRGAWLTHPATEELVFATDPAQLWKRVLRLKGWRYELLSCAPEDSSLN